MILNQWTTKIIVVLLYAVLLIYPYAAIINAFIVAALLLAGIAIGKSKSLWFAVLVIASQVILWGFPRLNGTRGFVFLVAGCTVLFLLIIEGQRHRWVAMSILLLTSLLAAQSVYAMRVEPSLRIALAEIYKSITLHSFKNTAGALLAVGAWRWVQLATVSLLGSQMLCEIGPTDYVRTWRALPVRPRLRAELAICDLEIGLAFLDELMRPLVAIINTTIHAGMIALDGFWWLIYYLANVVVWAGGIVSSVIWYLMRVAAFAFLMSLQAILSGLQVLLSAAALTSMIVVVPLLLSLIVAKVSWITARSFEDNIMRGGSLLDACVWLALLVLLVFVWLLLTEWSSGCVGMIPEGMDENEDWILATFFSNRAIVFFAAVRRSAVNFIDGYGLKRLLPYCLLAIFICNIASLLFHVGAFTFGAPAIFLLACCVVVLVVFVTKRLMRRNHEI